MTALFGPKQGDIAVNHQPGRSHTARMAAIEEDALQVRREESEPQGPSGSDQVGGGVERGAAGPIAPEPGMRLLWLPDQHAIAARSGGVAQHNLAASGAGREPEWQDQGLARRIADPPRVGPQRDDQPGGLDGDATDQVER